jgi:hypothetical protein
MEGNVVEFMYFQGLQVVGVTVNVVFIVIGLEFVVVDVARGFMACPYLSYVSALPD